MTIADGSFQAAPTEISKQQCVEINVSCCVCVCVGCRLVDSGVLSVVRECI